MVTFPLHRVALFTVLMLLTVAGFWFEKIPVNNHTGWDGKHYANLTIHFEELAAQHRIDSYQYQRILTPAVIFYTAKLSGITLNGDNIVQAFSAYNAILLLLCVLLFFHLSTFLKLSVPTEIIGFSCLFFNYVILKNTSYYPVLTDTTAFFFGFLLVYCFIRQKDTVLFLLTLLAQFCYPLLLVVSTPLVLGIRNNAISNRLQKFALYKVLAVILMLILLLGYFNILFVPNSILPKYTMELNRYLLPFSIAGVFLYIWKGFSAIGNVSTPTHTTLDFKTPIVKLITLFAFMFLCTYGISKISIPEDVFTPVVFINNVLQQSIDNPFVFFVAHCIYLGPGLLLILLLYKPFIQTLTKSGDSAILYFILALLFSIGSETRQFIHFYPFVIVILLITINSYRLSSRVAILFALCSLLVSKVWLPINRTDSFTQYLYGQFPDQYYFMNHGPFMSDASYLINAGVVVLELVIVWFLIIKRKDETLVAD